MNTEFLKNKIAYLKDNSMFESALKIAVHLHDAEPTEENAALLVELSELAEFDAQKVKREKMLFLTRKANTVNLVNHATMYAASVLREFIQKNGIDTKQDGKLTKKYETALKLELTKDGVLSDKLTWSVVTPNYGLDGIWFNIYGRYDDLEGRSQKYENSQYFSVENTKDNVLPSVLPIDRTAQFYFDNEIAMKKAKIDFDNAKAEYDRLKGIHNE